MLAPNRIDDLIPGHPRPAVTPRQAESSRQNGARSRGPKTAQGKQRSSGNAVRHGLFSARLQPGPADADAQADYEHLVRSLTAEHGPRTQLEVIRVETLAADLIHLRRVLQLRQRALAPGPRTLPPHARPVRWSEDYLARVQQLIDAFAGGEKFALTAEEAAGLARQFRQDLGVTREIVAGAAGARAAGERVTPRELVEEAVWRHIDPDGLGLGEEGRIEAVLADRPPAVLPEDRGRWTTLFEHMRVFARGYLECSREARAEVDARERDADRELGNNPPAGLGSSP